MFKWRILEKKKTMQYNLKFDLSKMFDFLALFFVQLYLNYFVVYGLVEVSLFQDIGIENTKFIDNIIRDEYVRSRLDCLRECSLDKTCLTSRYNYFLLLFKLKFTFCTIQYKVLIFKAIHLISTICSNCSNLLIQCISVTACKYFPLGYKSV